jgi:hypothetical protein
MSCLLYVKGSGTYPPRWGVTSNVVDRLRQRNKPGVVILLFESPNYGYVLSSADVEHYIRNDVWPLAKDGDYKP